MRSSYLTLIRVVWVKNKYDNNVRKHNNNPPSVNYLDTYNRVVDILGTHGNICLAINPTKTNVKFKMVITNHISKKETTNFY